MSQAAKVHSVEAIRDFRIALTNFAEEARNALSSAEMEVRRTRDWLLRDQLGYWQSQVKRGNEKVSMARTELHRRRLSQANSDAISDTEQKEALRAATRRLEEAEDMVKKCKSWVPVFEHAIAEYHSCSQPLGDRLTGSLVNSLSLLDRMLASLESYLALTAPTTPMPAPETSGGPGAVPTSSAGQSASTTTEAVEPPESGPKDESEEDPQEES